MPAVDLLDRARQAMFRCNLCGYCSGYCIVFDQARDRFSLTNGDLTHLANLCHDCRACHNGCQYAPPHVFQIDVPVALGALRTYSYYQYGWPRPIAELFRDRPYAGLRIVCLAMLAALLAILIPRAQLSGDAGNQLSFYGIIPLHVMMLIGSLPMLWSVVAITISIRKYWRDIAPTVTRPYMGPQLLAVAADLLLLRHWGKESRGCPDHTGRMTMLRKYLHWILVYGLAFCGLATIAAAGYHHILDLTAPYALTSAPVLLGMSGGSAIIIGASGLMIHDIRGGTRFTRDRSLAPSLLIVAATGLSLLAFRDTPVLALLLHIHLGAVSGFFLTLPYGHFLHAPFRGAALLRTALEHRMPIAIRGV